ncbi:MAG TPA: hypothetical protein VHO03_16210 [Ignavibacteriales bacterium]|nr:hypothetical protein [Ignavibacteriales bacterium]
MGLLPIVGKALGLFSFLSVSALAISYILYKMRSPKAKPYKRTSVNPYQSQQNLRPESQRPYYPVPAMAAPERLSVPNAMNVPAGNNFPERTYMPERVSVQERDYTAERKQERKVYSRPRIKFQILQTSEDGEIKAYHLHTR